MPARGHVGPPHVQHPKSAFNSLDMFAQLTALGDSTPDGARVTEAGDTRLTEAGDTRVIDE